MLWKILLALLWDLEHNDGVDIGGPRRSEAPQSPNPVDLFPFYLTWFLTFFYPNIVEKANNS